MFADGAYLFDAGWVFFAAWSLVLIAFFLVAFGEDFLLPPQRDGNAALKEAQSRLRSADSRER